jgi:predicted GNAT superfamily acetyltransferase
MSDPTIEPIVIRRAESPADYIACQDAQRRSWGLVDESYVVPVATLVGANLHGGLVLGAFLEDGTAAGLSFAFLGKIEGMLGLYSQLTGVVPEYQGRGLGRRMKQAQFMIAEAEGLACVAWAFDPLQAGNARFNLETLQATASHYVVDMYGPRTDDLNAGIPTDRLIAVWKPGQPPRPTLPEQPFGTLPLLIDPDGPAARPIEGRVQEPLVLLEIPSDLAALRASAPERANRWRLAAREAFGDAFRNGYRAVGTVKAGDGEERRQAYVLHRPSAEEPG